MHNNHRSIFKYLIGLLVILVLVSAYLFFFGTSSFTESKVNLTLTGPTQVSSGDQVAYKVHYDNTTNTTLHNIQLSFNFPAGAVIVQNGKVITATGNIQTMNQDDLAPGQGRDLEFDAFLVGDLGNIKTAQVKINFSAGSIVTPFEKDTNLSTTISSVPVDLTLVGPPTVTSGQNVSFILNYRNQTSADISDLQLVMTYPDGFTFTKATPAPSSGNNTWAIPTLKAGEGEQITIQGKLSGTEGGSKVATANLKRNVDGTYIDYEQTNSTSTISSNLLGLSALVNNSASYISHAGDTLQYEIDYQNNSNYNFSNLVLAVGLQGGMYDLSQIDPGGGFYDSNSQTITWNSTAIPQLASLPPHANGNVKFSIKLRPTITGSGSASSFVHAAISLTSPDVPDGFPGDQTQVQDDVITKISSQPIFTQTMYYNDPAFGSSGPYPPKVGQSTNFTVHWKLVNPGTAFNNAKVVATLPLGVTWLNAVSVGASQPQPTYNKNTSQLTWNLGTLPAGVGTGGNAAYELVFQVSVQASPTEVGLPMPVLTGPTLSGADSFTGQNIIVHADDLNSNSPADENGNGAVTQ